ncbi:MAG: class I SAM-dependent methyltransferase [Candidatus Aenigmarchaeota archaeon]|nr:class I SAM-dependent methyltransferase [Candidatus Aenigmarchaeota archaeon]
MSNYVEEFWDKSSKEYRFNQWEKSAIARFDYTLTRNILLRFLKLNKNDTVLEIGCGPGKWTKLISEKCGKMVAVDISEEMINEAKRYCKNKNVRFIHGDIAELNSNKKFDKIVAIRSIEYIPDKDKMFEKIMSLLKDNGKIVIITKSKPCLWGVTKKEKNFWQDKISPKRLSELCIKYGLSNITVKPVIIRLPIFANGNREFPLIWENLERIALKFFKRITETSQNSSEIFKNLALLISESYLLCGEKNISSK